MTTTHKNIAIMQPTYLPWVGYFALMDRVDEFVFLDCVQFDRRSWQQRNRIKGPNGEIMLTIPVKKGPRDSLMILDVEIEHSVNFTRKHIASIEIAYKKAPHFKEFAPRIFAHLDKQYQLLADLTINLSLELRDCFGIQTPSLRASELTPAGSKDELLHSICTTLGATEYTSPPGSKTYLDNSLFFGPGKLPLAYHMYSPVTYRQLHGEFLPYMAAIDLLFNEGSNSLSIIRAGIQRA